MNEEGSVLTNVLLLVGLLVLLAVPVLQLATASYQKSINEQIKTQAFYLAEAGACHSRSEAIAHIVEKSEIVGWNPKNINPTQPFIAVGQQLGSGTYQANAFLTHQNGDTYLLRIESEGKASTNDRLAQTVSLAIPITIIPRGNGSLAPPLDMAVFADTALSLAATSIRGDVVTNATGSNSIKLFWAPILEHMINGDLTLGVGADPETVVKLPWRRSMAEVVRGQVRNLTTPVLFPSPLVPAPPIDLFTNTNLSVSKGATHAIVGDGYYPEINVQGRLDIDVGSGERVVRVGKLTIGNSGELQIIGDGRLVLYVDEAIDMKESAQFNSGRTHERVLVYYLGDREFFVRNCAVFNGSLRASQADVQIAHFGSMSGHIVTGGSKVKLAGILTSGVSLIYAPNAKVDIAWRVDFVWDFLGAIVSRECNIEASFPLRYDARVREIYEELVGSVGAIVKPETPIWSPR